MKMLPSLVRSGHPDYESLFKIKTGIISIAGGEAALQAAFPLAVRDAIDFVLDPIRTGRTELVQLDNVEKTFIGLKIEHYVRDFLKAPKGIRDLEINGQDVDIKNTLDNNWMIPPETFRTEDPCLVINSKEQESTCWMGLMLARQDYLNAPNRDGKRGVKSAAVANVLWLVEEAHYPESVWRGFDMAEFRELRERLSGTKRAAEFFRKNLGRVVPREVVEALLYDQKDPMKRLRGNQGARDMLRTEGIALLSDIYGNRVLTLLGRPQLIGDSFIAIKPTDEVEKNTLVQEGAIDA